MSSNNPMDALHALAKRIEEVTKDLNVELIRFVACPSRVGPDVIQCSFDVKPDAVKSSEEVESSKLESDFMAVLGDFTVTGDVESGIVSIEGAETSKDEETKQEREFRKKQREELIEKMKRSLGEDDDD